jgi:hypothetical protein
MAGAYGLQADEIIAKLKKGETVRTPEQEAALAANQQKSDAGIIVYAQTNANPYEIGREIAWQQRTQR